MTCKQYHSDPVTGAPVPDPGQSLTGTWNNADRGWATASKGGPACRSAVLQSVAAGMKYGPPPVQFMESIDAANGQLGNRAFMRWVEALHTAGRGRENRINSVQGRQGPVQPRAGTAPLQFMPKKRRNKDAAAEATPAALTEAAQQTGAADVPEGTLEASSQAGAQGRTEGAVTPPREDTGEAAVSGGKKAKRKSRVQIAINTLREQGVEAFKANIEAMINEVELLHRLEERVQRAEDLSGVRDAALGTIAAWMAELDPEAVPAMPQVPAPVVGQPAGRPVAAPAKAKLEYREQILVNCCLTGDLANFRQYFKSGKVGVNLADERGTLLLMAAVKGHTGMVRELLSKPGIDVNLANGKGSTPLQAAAELGRVGIVKLLLAAPGINPNLGTFRLGTTPLAIAVHFGRLDVVRLLLAARDIDVNVRQQNGGTPLFLAVQNNFPALVELLVSRGADVNLTLNDGTSPLCSAAYLGNTEVVRRLLLAPDIQVDHTTHEQVTALVFAVQHRSKDIVEILLDKGANPDIVDDEGVAPLHIACIHGFTEIAVVLLNAGADMELKAGGIYTPQQIARWAGHPELAELVKERSPGAPEQAAESGRLSPCLRPAEPAPRPASSREQVPEDQPGQPSPSTVPSASSLQAGTVPVAQAGEAATTSPPTLESEVIGGMVPAAVTQVAGEPVAMPETVPGNGSQSTESQSPLVQAKNEFIKDILARVTSDRLDHLDGIRLMGAVNMVTNLDGLCSIYNRLASIERKKLRSGRRPRMRPASCLGAEATRPVAGFAVFSLGDKQRLDADAVEVEIRQYLEPRYHRFVSQAVNDMEFGRGKPTSGYPGLLHASAGIPGVGSCCVFFYPDADARMVRIAGIGRHLDRETYRLDYALEELGGSGTILQLS